MSLYRTIDEAIRTDLGRIWDGLEMILGRFGGIFGTISDRLSEKSKIWEFWIEKMTLKWPQIHLKIIKKTVEISVKNIFLLLLLLVVVVVVLLIVVVAVVVVVVVISVYLST